MPYTYAQFIAYQVETLAPFSTKADRLLDDLILRVDNLFAVMTYCQSQLTNDSDDILKVFVAPEFFLRFPGGQKDGTGHYGWDDMIIALRRLKEKCKLKPTALGQPMFKHWLVIPGTVVFRERRAKVGEPGNDSLIFNSLPVFMGDGSVAHTINKYAFDDIDKLDRRRNGADQEEEQQKQQFRPLGVEGAEFKPLQIANINVGFEVCADHGNARLRTYLLSLKQSERPKLSVHVLTACGKRAIPDSAAATQNGYLFRCDGNPGNFGSNDFLITRTTEKKVITTILTGNPTVTTQKLPDDLQINKDQPKSQVSIYGKRALPQIQAPS